MQPLHGAVKLRYLLTIVTKTGIITIILSGFLEESDVNFFKKYVNDFEVIYAVLKVLILHF